MLLKRALFLVSAENEVEPLVEFAKVFKKRYNVKVDAVYVKDILKYDVFPVTVEGIGINLGTNFAYKEFRNIENKTFEKIKAPLEKEFSKVYTKEGESAEVALEELKKYDLIVIGFGKAGKTLATKLSKMGKSVTLIEKDENMYGGTCINVRMYSIKKTCNRFYKCTKR